MALKHLRLRWVTFFGIRSIMNRQFALRTNQAFYVPRNAVKRGSQCLAAALVTAALTQTGYGSENEPHRAFAQWAEVPLVGQFIAGVVYEESEAYTVWAGHQDHNVTTHASGERYGIDINQGYLALQYGITERWAADLNLGYTTCGWRYFDGGDVQSTTGVMDASFGVRYQLFKEDPTNSAWMPTLTFRAGAILPGTFDKSFQFAPGNRSAAIEPEFLARKHFGWTGFGAYTDCLFRWNRTTDNDQYITVIGLFQEYKNWEVDAGYRHLQSVTGSDITWNGDYSAVTYPRELREINDSIEAGFSYTTSKRHIRYGFHSRTVFDGSNTDSKFWVGGSVDVPFGGRSS
jgi:hypothetical protein